MSFSNTTGAFSLNNVIVRKPIMFPDGTIQSTAYTGAGGVPTIEEILVSGDDAGGESITGLTSITFADTTTQSTAYTGASGVPTIEEVLISGDDANGLDIVGVDNLSLTSITFPDTSVQTTAFTGLPAVKTYTLEYTTSQTITMPTGCRAIDLRVIGAGGLAGLPFDVAEDYVSGGSGSGGNSVFGTNLPIGQGVQLTLTTSNTPSSGFTEVLIGATSIAKAFNGLTGGDAQQSLPETPGAGASPNATPSTYNASYGTFNTYTGTAGVSGGVGDFASTGGHPFGYQFSDGGIGCGQRWRGDSSGPLPPDTAQGPGGAIITYYLV